MDFHYGFFFKQQALTSHDSTRTRIWFPMFSYFESSVDGIIPNEYSSLEDICSDLYGCIGSARDNCMLTARRFWLANQQLVSQEFSKKIFLFSFSKDESSEMMVNNSAQNHQESNLTNTMDVNNIKSNIDIASNNLNNTNVTSQKTKKQN